MPENVDPLRNLCDFAYKFGEWVFSFVAKHCPTLSETQKRKTISKFTAEEESDSLSMAHSDPIDITSSDSENESKIRDVNEVSLISSASPTPRKLPSWASNVNAKLNSYNGLSRNLQQSERASSSSERLTNHNLPLNFKFQKHPNSIHRDATYNQNVALAGNPNISTTKPANGFHAEHLNDNDYGNFASQLSQKRLLPPSLQPLASTSKAKASMDNEGASIKPKAYVENGYTDIHSKPYPPLGTNGIDHKFHATNNLTGNNSDEIYMYERPGARLLPPSLVHGRPSSSQSAAPIDSTLRPGVEQSPSENDERLIYQAALQNLAQPKDEADLPDGLLAVPLMKHQKIALAWMYLKETTSVHCLGGILADDQGLGKTISMIALILLQRHLQSIATAEDAQKVKTEALNLDDDDEISEVEKEKHTEEPCDVKPIPKVRAALPASHKGRPAAGTLVVCPASVLRQWGREIDDKVTDDHKLSVLIYHGGTRTKDPLELARHDVVLTTYAIVANEVPKHVDDNEDDQNEGDKYGLSSDFLTNKKRKKASNSSKKGKKGRKGLDGSAIDCGTLAKVGWSRVILDEAQTIKNYRTQVSRACCGLRAKRRRCLSGTPIQNTIDDLFSYFRFLKYDPYAVKRSFCANIKLPISKDAAQGYKKLQAVLKTIMLRRTKGTLLDGKPIINIPPKTVCLVKVDFSIEEREFYTKLETDSRAQFKSYAAAGTVNQNYANILLMLLRLRQACDHPFLVNKGHTNEFVGKASVEMARQLTKETLQNLLSLLEDPICSMCSDPPEQAVVTICGHVYCYQCVSEYLTGEDNACPAHDCKAPLGTDVVFAKATLRNCISGDDSDASSSLDIVDQSSALQNMYSSSKIRAALSILEKNANSTQANGPIKTIVFSQWTGMLDLIETSLNHSCIQYRRFDGTMSLALRDKAVKDFNTDLEVTVMLMSLKAGNLGLNMVAACQVILLDLWWNPTTEDQAVDRAHRIGQTRAVTVSRLTITGTVEDRILSLQEEKRKMVASAFGEDPTGGVATRLTVDDLRYLFMI